MFYVRVHRIHVVSHNFQKEREREREREGEGREKRERVLAKWSMSYSILV